LLLAEREGNSDALLIPLPFKDFYRPDRDLSSHQVVTLLESSIVMHEPPVPIVA